MMHDKEKKENQQIGTDSEMTQIIELVHKLLKYCICNSDYKYTPQVQEGMRQHKYVKEKRGIY